MQPVHKTVVTVVTVVTKKVVSKQLFSLKNLFTQKISQPLDKKNHATSSHKKNHAISQQTSWGRPR